jgi:hypothetical protein
MLSQVEIKSKQKLDFSRLLSRVTRDRCYDFLKYFAEKFSEKIGVFDSNQR